jgi:signal transduction histidine kinase
MQEIAADILTGHPDPLVWITTKLKIAFANESAKKLFGQEFAGVPCWEYIYAKDGECALCVRKDPTWGVCDGALKRCRMVTATTGQEEEKDVAAWPLSISGQDISHFEVFHPVSRMRMAVRAVTEFGHRLDAIDEPEDVLYEWVDFLGGGASGVGWRARLYTMEGDIRTEGMVLKRHDKLEASPEYRDGLIGRVLARPSDCGEDHSFLCVDQRRWFILTSEEEKAKAFDIHFKANPRGKLEEGNLIHDAQDVSYRPPLSLHVYNDKAPAYKSIFEGDDPHTWLDIPISTKDVLYGKMSISLKHDSVLFYRERIEELVLSLGYVTRRLEVLEALAKVQHLAALDVIHEVAQPAFAGLASMEALRRRDQENGRTAKKELVEFYLKKNVECSLKMVAFLNDRSRINDEAANYSDIPCNLLANVLAPVVNMTRFSIYETHLAESGDEADPRQFEDVSEIRKGRDRLRSVVSICGSTRHAIEYDQDCDEINVYVERYRLQQTFYNLLNNAHKYRRQPEGLTIRVAYREYAHEDGDMSVDFGQYYIIDVMDEGIGVEKDEMDKIFGLFKQGRYALRAARVPGTGRGLYVCRSILRGIGGDIFVWKRHDPTIFRILIPRECAEPDWPANLDELKARTRSVVKNHVRGTH